LAIVRQQFKCNAFTEVYAWLCLLVLAEALGVIWRGTHHKSRVSTCVVGFISMIMDDLRAHCWFGALTVLLVH